MGLQTLGTLHQRIGDTGEGRRGWWYYVVGVVGDDALTVMTIWSDGDPSPPRKVCMLISPPTPVNVFAVSVW
jgi:hypothetical protein